jgi:streptogramin lyase
VGYRCMRPVVITMLAGAALSACSGLGTNSLPGNVRSSTPDRVHVTMHLVIAGPHRPARLAGHQSRTKRPKFVSPSTNGVLVAVYRHGAAHVPADIIAQAAVDVSSGSKACGGHRGFPRTCTASIDIPPTKSSADDLVVSSYDAAPVGESFASAHLLGYGTLVDQTIVPGKANVFAVFLGGVVDGLSGNPAFVSLPGDGSSHALGISIDPTDFNDNPIVAGPADPFANPIDVTVNETGVSGHALLSLNGGAGATHVTVSHSSDTVQLQYDGNGSIGYGMTVTLDAGHVDRAGGATEAIAVSPLLLGSTSSDYTPGKLALKGNGDELSLDIGELNAPGTTTYAESSANCYAIADTSAFTQASASSASFSVLARGTISTPLPGSGCTITVSDGTSAVDVATTNHYSGVLGTPVITETQPPTSGAGPAGIAVGPDGDMWFAEANVTKLAKLSPTTATSTDYAMPITDGTPVPNGIATGPDGNLWWADPNSHSSTIGKMTTLGAATPFAPQTSNTEPQTIVAGPDGAMWFAEDGANSVGRMPIVGPASYFTVPTRFGGPYGITVGADGNLWFTEAGEGKIGKITTGGVITEYPLPSSTALPIGITAGPDGPSGLPKMIRARSGAFQRPPRS